MRRSIALLLVAAALTQAAEIDPCDRQPFRGRCPNANGAQTRSQFVLRYYMRNNECVSYPYGHCANDASEPELYRYKEECEQACLAPGNLGERIPFGDSFETYGTVGPLDKAAVNPSTRSPVTVTPLPTTAAPTTRDTPSTTAVHSTTVRSTTPSTTTTTETARTECERRRALASSSLIKGGFVPECDRNGNFARTQCEPDARQCFCVDEDGIEVSNSRTRDGSTPDCDGIIRASPPRTNECVGIPETGPCSSNLVRWHYDEEALECKTFAYSGCGGNGNNYDTEEACRDRCVPVSVECPRGLPLRSTQGYYVNCAKQSCPAGYECHTIGAQAICCEQEKKSEVDNLHSGVAAGDICAMPKERGPCDKYELRFFFNAETKECKYFFFGGCEGNGNNFARVEDCEQRCGVKKAPSTVQTAPPTTLPPTTTPLRTQPTTRPTTRQTTRAQPAVPNPSDFGPEVPDFSEDASAETVAFVPVTESPRPTGATRDMAEGNRCAHPLDMGNCQGHFVRWFWNEQKANCEVFTYTGCQGNGNNFASREECLSICNGEALARGGIIPTAAAVMNVCKHDVDAGECNGVFQRFAFESEAGECRPFTYGGCGGNGNNFATMVECKQRCQQDTVSGDVCTSTVDSGECSGLFQRFAFDRAMGDCRPFNYGGCGGNGNNFASLGECRTQCNHALAPGCPARPACDFQRCQMLLDIRGCPICSCPPHDGVVPPVAQCPPVDPSRCVEPCTTFTNRLGCTECSCPREGESAQPPPSVPIPQSTSPSTTASTPTSVRPTSPRASPPAPHHHFSPSPPAASSAPSPPSAPSAPAPSRGHVRQEAVTTHDTQDKPLPPPSHSSPSKTSPLPSPTHKPVSLPDALGEKCMQPLDAGPCDRFIERFYFDAKDGRCHSFRYGGCAGNRNHFFTQKECEIHCARFSNFLSEADPTLAMISRRLSENADQSLPFMETPGTVHTTLPLPSPTTVLPQRGQGGGAASLPPTFKPIPMEEILQWAMEHEGPEATANPKGTKVAKAVAPTRTAPVTTTTHSVPTTTRAVPTTVRTVPTTARPAPTHPTTVKIAPHTVVETHRHEGKTRVEQSVDEPVKKVVPTPIEGVIRVPNPPRVIVPQDQTLPKEVFDRFIHDVDTFHHSFVKEKNGEIPPPFPIHHSHRTPMPSGTLHLFHVPDGNAGIAPSHPLAPHMQHIMRVGEQMMRANSESARVNHQRVVDLTPLTSLHEESVPVEGKRVKGSRTKVLAHPSSERVRPLVPLPGMEEEKETPGVAVMKTSEEVIPLRHRPAPLRVKIRPIPKKESSSEEEEEKTTPAASLVKATAHAARKISTTHAATETTTHPTTTTHAAKTESTTHAVTTTTEKMEDKVEKKSEKKDGKKHAIKKIEKVVTETPVVTIPEMAKSTTVATTTTTTNMPTMVSPMNNGTVSVVESAEETSDEDSSKEEETSTDETTEETVTEDEEEEREEEDDYVVISESGKGSERFNSTIDMSEFPMRNGTESMEDSDENSIVDVTVATSTQSSTPSPSTASSTMTTTESTTTSTDSPISIENSTMSSSESEEELSEEDMEEGLAEGDQEVLSPSNSTSNSSISHNEVMDMASMLSSFTDLLSNTNSTPQLTPSPTPPFTPETVSLADFLGALSLDEHSSTPPPSTQATPTSEEETTPLPISVDEDTPRFLLPPPSEVEEIPNRFRPPDNLDILLKSMNESITRESRHIEEPSLPSHHALSALPSVPSVHSVANPSTPPLSALSSLPSLSSQSALHESASIQSLPSDAVDVHVSPTKKLPLHRIVGGNTLPAQPVQPTPTPTAAPLPLPHPAAPRAIETSAEEGTRPHESAAPVHNAPEQAIQGGLEVNLAEVEDISMETASETTPIPNSIAEVSPSTTTTSIPLPPSTFQPFPLAESTFAPFPVADSTFVPVPTPAATFAPLPTPSVTLAPFPQPALSLKEEEKKEEAVFPVPAQMENEYEEEEEEEETDDSDVAPSTEQTTSPSTSPSTTPSTTTASTTTIVPLPVLPDGAGRQPVPSAPVGIAAITEELPAIVADPTAVCGLSAEAGPCFDYSPRWYYNPANSRCEQFSYGGCGGNGNNFAERKTCEVRCAVSGSAPSLLSQVPERCTLPKDIGTGGGFASKWFFSMQSLRCEQFVFEGVGGNSNQFDSLSDCERLCTPADDGANKELSEEDEEDYDGVEGEEPNFGSDDASPPKSALPPPLTSVDDSTDLTEKTPEVAPAVHGSKTVQKNYHTDPIRSVVDVNGEELPIVAPSPPETVNYQTGHRAAGIRTFAESNGRVAIENAESVDDEEEAPAAHPALPSCPNSAPELKYADGRPVMCLPGKNQCPDKSVCYFNGLDYFCCPEDEDPYDKHVFGGYNGEETKQGYKRFGHLNIRRLRDSVIDHSRRKRDAVEARLFSVDPLRFDGAPIKQISSARSAKSIRRHPGNKRKTACDYPLEKGECAEQHLRFFYDKASDSCRLFHYSGCNGNANNFGSIGDCQEKCVKGMKDTAAQQQKMASALPPGTCPSGEPLGGSAPVLCGNTTESIGCPKGYFCRQGPPDVCCPNLSLNEILAASSSVEVPVKETEQTTVPTPSTTTTKAPQHYCPDASDPLLTKAGKIRTCGSGFDGLKMCPKGFYCAINADQNTRLCCPILGSSSRIPYQHGVIPPYFGKRNPNSGELIGRGSLPADQKTALVDEESTEMDKKAMDDFIVPKSPKGSSLERFIDEAEVKSEEEEDEDMARMMLKPTKHQEEQKEVADIILPSIEAENSPVMISNVPTPVLESETTVLPKETFDRSRCQMRPDEGRPCREDEVAPRTNLHYFYSEVDGRCKLYFYKGCGGNENRFERKADCQTTCMA